ncbi:hypothetical protein HNR46_001509 [Haloferula luteola]|uniref:Uncharacterized protein n=1 Tax=Haloferula luteola TaxID=595692 RepID=A0A840V1J9_9BACT|nr:hypothetical protein [Haloferula luteola]
MKGQEERQRPEESAPSGGEAGDAKEAQGTKTPEVSVGDERKKGEMSREEALRLLESLGNDERVVIPVPLSDQNRERRGRNRKTW